MPVERKLQSVSFFDIKSGEEIDTFDFSDCNVSMDFVPMPPSKTFQPSGSLEFEISNDDLENAKRAFGVEEVAPEKCNFIFETKIQKRRHRKRRINKKWAKRYGYYHQKYILKDGEILNYSNDDKSFDITFSKLVKAD